MHFIAGANSRGAAGGMRQRQEGGGWGVGWSRRSFLAPPGILVQHNSLFHTEAEGNPSVLQGFTHPCPPGAHRAALCSVGEGGRWAGRSKSRQSTNAICEMHSGTQPSRKRPCPTPGIRGGAVGRAEMSSHQVHWLGKWARFRVRRARSRGKLCQGKWEELQQPLL